MDLLVSVEDFQASREAVKAKVDAVSEQITTSALEDAQALLHNHLSFDPNDLEDDGAKQISAKRFIRIAAAWDLAGTLATSNYPNVPGAVLTGLSADGADFSFYTETTARTGYAVLDRILDEILGTVEEGGIVSIQMTRE